MKRTLTGTDEEAQVLMFFIHVVNILHFIFCSSLKNSPWMFGLVCICVLVRL